MLTIIKKSFETAIIIVNAKCFWWLELEKLTDMAKFKFLIKTVLGLKTYLRFSSYFKNIFIHSFSCPLFL